MATSFKRDRARIAALSVLTLCCVGFIGGMTYLQSRAAAPPAIVMRQTPDPQLVVEAETRKKEKILELRDKWQVWAKAHQPQLRAMLQAQPNDLAALAGVADAIPASPTKQNCGITPEDLSGMENYSDPVVMMVSYNHGGMDAVPARPELAADNEKAKGNTRAYDRAAFELMHDVMVTSTSSAWSRKNYCLFASGRVTQCEYLIPGFKQNYIDIAPSYDFLVSSKQNS